MVAIGVRTSTIGLPKCIPSDAVTSFLGDYNSVFLIFFFFKYSGVTFCEFKFLSFISPPISYIGAMSLRVLGWEASIKQFPFVVSY